MWSLAPLRRTQVRFPIPNRFACLLAFSSKWSLAFFAEHKSDPGPHRYQGFDWSFRNTGTQSDVHSSLLLRVMYDAYHIVVADCC